MKNQKRLTKTEYYLSIAEQVATRSTCLVSKYGCVIVKNDIIVSTGYNGSPRGVKNCSDTGVCLRDVTGNRRYDACRSVHSEANALLQANYSDLIGSTIYISRYDKSESSNETVESCQNCKRLLLNAQVEKVVCRQVDGNVISVEPKIWINQV